MTDKFQALMIDKKEDEQSVNFVKISEDELMEGNVLVDVTHSSLNYKDGLALTGAPGVVRSFPMIAGIDFSASSSSRTLHSSGINCPISPCF